MKVDAYKVLVFCYIAIAAVVFGLRSSDYLAFKDNVDSIAVVDWNFDRVTKLKLTRKDNNNISLSAEEIGSTISQELFSQTRKPFVLPVQPVILVEPPPEPPRQAYTPEPQLAPLAAPATDPARFKLLGTANISNRWRALVLVTEQPEANWSEVGNKVLDWTITAISPHEIMLENAGQNFVLKQYVENK
jgi:hypothetical protein